jgi:hypothetical protein
LGALPVWILLLDVVIDDDQVMDPVLIPRLHIVLMLDLVDLVLQVYQSITQVLNEHVFAL